MKNSFQLPVFSYQFIKTWRWALLAGAAILGTAIFLRTYNLLTLPIFADEAIYVRWAQIMRAEPTLRFLPLSDGKQPLFMWVVMTALKFLADPLIVGRLVSAFSGIGTLLGIFLLCLRLFSSRRIALVASLFYAVSPFSVFFDRMALADSMLTMFGVWALYFGVLTAQTRRLDFAMLTGFALGAAWLTKSPAIFFLLLLPTTILVAKLPKTRRWQDALKLFGLWAISWFMSLVVYNTLRLGPNFQLIASRNRDYVFSFQEALTHPFDPLQFHLREIVEWLAVLLPGTVLLFAVVGLIVGLRQYRKEVLLIVLWVAFPLLVQAEFAKVFTARYILFSVPLLFIMAGVSAEFAFEKLKKTSGLLLVLVILVPAIWVDYLFLFDPQKAPLPRVERSGYLEEWTAGTGIREVAEFVKNEKIKNPSQGILVGTEGFFGTLPNGLEIYLADIPGVVIKGVGISISSVHESLIEAKKASNRVFLVVNSSRFEGKPENLGLTFLDSYPKATRPDGTRESLLLFEVTEEAIKIFNVKKAS